uniref:Uncharacterized protein n=1 Tax=Tanacetum cinerariifolium TaxID=118510 RepID=A0A699GLP1_TANCI|nr:hypothetical protein [Tanacetum cinerariifolium]
MEESKLHLGVDYKKKLYDVLVESYNTDKDLFNTYGEAFTLKRSRDGSDKDRDPFAGSDRGTKRKKSSKEAESSKDSMSKEKKSSRTFKDASQSQHKSSKKSAHTEEPSHTVDDSGVKDLQLGVECYQKKLNFTKPDTFRSNLINKTTYTAYSDPKGVIYKDHMNRNRLMCVDELYKFSDGMLDDVWSALNDIANGIRMEYLQKKK